MGCLCLALWGVGVSNNAGNGVGSTTEIYTLVPGFAFLDFLVMALSLTVTNESVLQWMWCFSAVALFSACVANQLAWQNSFPDQVINQERVAQLNPISLFNVTELGWFHTACLVFITATTRPRHFFVMVLTMSRFATYAIGSFMLAVDLGAKSVCLRLFIYAGCCFFNMVCSHRFELNERQAWYLRQDLASKLRVEKEKLVKEALAKTEAERILVAYLLSRDSQPIQWGAWVRRDDSEAPG
jgi:hypothetical protein